MFKSSKFNEIIHCYRENKLSHAFLLETNDIETCYKDILELVKILNCSYEYLENCDKCNLCNLIDLSNLPSLITIEADGNNIKKEQVLSMMEKFSSVPIYSKFNIYIVKDCNRFNYSSANTLLKFLEEPEDNIIGFFITINKSNVISTIRSRCQEYTIMYNQDDIEKYSERTIDIINGYINQIMMDDNIYLYNKNIMIKTFEDRIDWYNFFSEVIYYLNDVYQDKIVVKKDDKLSEFSKKLIINIICLIEEVLKYIKSNVNIDLILDKFVIEMRDLCE